MIRLKIILVCIIMLSNYQAVNGQDTDCIFDLETQTNDFLIETPFWENHNWDVEAKTAYVKLTEADSLEIYRGGCSHFGYYVSLISSSQNADISDDAFWIAEIQKWTHQLPDFDNDFVYALLENRGEPDESSPNQLVWYLDDENYCVTELWIEFKHGKVEVRLGYYLC
jgi:hypothetical protein